LKELRKKVAIGFLGGSDLNKIKEQLEVNGSSGTFSRPTVDLFSQLEAQFLTTSTIVSLRMA
jgi:hypothetical protein